MNPHLCRVALRPRGPLQVFDLALALMRAHPAPFLRLGAVSVLPPALVASLALGLGHVDAVVLGVLPAVFLAVHAPSSVLAGRLLFSESVRARDVIGELVRSPISWAASWLWQALALGAGLLCGGVGALIAMPATIYVTEAALLEKVGPIRCLRRSSRLASFNLGNALTATIAWLGLTAWGGLVGEAAGQAVFGFVLQLGAPFGTLADGRVTPYLVTGALAAQPLFAVYKLLLYVDARTRVEGWDLQVGLRAAGLGAR